MLGRFLLWLGINFINVIICDFKMVLGVSFNLLENIFEFVILVLLGFIFGESLVFCLFM